MTRRHAAWFTVPALLMAVVLTAAPQQTASAERQLEAAIHREQVLGDVKGAIEQYKTLAQGGNRAVAAQALLRLGGCYEKLGQEDARKTYQQLLDTYPEQQQEVAAARQRLALLAGASREVVSRPKFRQLVIPSKPPSGGGAMLSPDGARIAFVAEGSVWTVPIQGEVSPNVAGQPVRLTPDVGAWDDGNTSVAWSGDGKWIAFRGKSNALYTVPSSGGEAKQIPNSGECQGGICRPSLSPDGKTVAIAQQTSTDIRLFVLPVAGGTGQRLTPGVHPALSPDGRRIAYIAGPPPAVQVATLPSRGETPFVIHTTEGPIPISPVWSPDGRMVAFLVRIRKPDEAGILPAQVWVVPVSEQGAPLADPTPFGLEEINTATVGDQPRLKLAHSLGGWSARNEIALVFQTPLDQAIYTIPVSGGLPSRVAMLGREPRWSPDGQTIIFRGQTNIEWVPAQGGKDTPIPIRGKLPMTVSFPVGSNDVSSDGKWIVFSGSQRGDPRGGPGIWIIAVEGGEPRQLTSNSLGDANPTWSPDGKWIAFTKTIEKGERQYGSRICLIASEGGEAKEISSETDQVAYAELDWSPDGANIAYFGTDNSIRQISPKGGPSRVLAQIPSVLRSSLRRYSASLGLSWSPDGSRLAYSSAGKAWIIPASGGEAQELRTGFNGRVTQLSWSPDGQKLAFTGETGGNEEVWLMSDFLHLVKTAR